MCIVSLQEEYFFCGGFPPSLNTIHVLGDDNKLANVEVQLQFNRYRYMYEQCAYNALSKENKERTLILPYNGMIVSLIIPSVIVE